MCDFRPIPLHTRSVRQRSSKSAEVRTLGNSLTLQLRGKRSVSPLKWEGHLTDHYRSRTGRKGPYAKFYVQIGSGGTSLVGK